MAPKRNEANVETLEALLDEVDEYYELYRRIRRKLKRQRRGSNSYLDLLPDLDVELFTLKLKVEHAHQELDDFEESLSDEDEKDNSSSRRGKFRTRAVSR